MSYIPVGTTGKASKPTVTGNCAQNPALVSMISILTAQNWFLNGTTNTGPQVPNAPTSSSATGIGSSSFVANWTAGAVDSTHDIATSYRLDVSANSGFSSFVSGYNNLNVGNVTSYTVSGLSPTTAYWFRVRGADSAGSSSNSSSQTLTTTSAPVTQTFTPTILARSGALIQNPLVGQHDWYGQGRHVSGFVLHDVYTRWSWISIENSVGSYDFSQVDTLVSQATSQGGRCGFGIIPIDISQGGRLYPNGISGGWSYTYSGVTATIPDWNNSGYISAWQNMMAAMGNHIGPNGIALKNDYHIGWIDASPLGDWDEWHIWPWEQDGPSGQTMWTNSTANACIRAVTNNFPNALYIQPSDWQPGLGLAQAIVSNAGVTNKCWGSSGLGGDSGTMNSTPYTTAWQTGMVYGEWCNDVGQSGIDLLCNTQVQQYHISMVAGDEPSPDPNSEQEFLNAVKLMGFRIQLDSMTLPGSITRGSSFQVVTNWENVNVAPTYMAWTIKIQLRSTSLSASAWSGNSSLDLRTLLPNAGSPQSQTDTFTVPSSVSVGTYHVILIISDNQNITPQMNLAIAGQQSDGSYDLGTVSLV